MCNVTPPSHTPCASLAQGSRKQISVVNGSPKQVAGTVIVCMCPNSLRKHLAQGSSRKGTRAKDSRKQFAQGLAQGTRASKFAQAWIF